MFKKLITKFIGVFVSREFAFIFALLGTCTQIFHNYYLAKSISSFEGFALIFQALILSTFISTSLLYFVAITDPEDDVKDYKRNLKAVNLFTFIEITINLYYYTRHLIIISEESRIFDFLFAIIISIIIPLTIKLYAGSIKAKAWMKELSENEKVEIQQINIDIPEVEKIIESKLEKIESDLNDGLDEKLLNSVESYLILSDNNSKFKDIIKKEIMGELKQDITSLDEERIKELFDTKFEKFRTNLEKSLNELQQNRKI